MCDENNEVANTASPFGEGYRGTGREPNSCPVFFRKICPGAPTTLVGFTDEHCLRITAVRWSPTLRGLTKCRGVGHGVRASVRLNVFPSAASHAVRSPTLVAFTEIHQPLITEMHRPSNPCWSLVKCRAGALGDSRSARPNPHRYPAPSDPKMFLIRDKLVPRQNPIG